jgi:hypothetical protein
VCVRANTPLIRAVRPVAVLLALCCCLSAAHSQCLEKTLYLPDSFSRPLDPECLVYDSANNTIYVGGYVSLAKLKLFQIEEQPGDDGGVQSWGSGMTFVTRLRSCTPNPFARGTSVNYELAHYGTVELTVHDVSGRLVSRLESGPRQRGFHAVRWDGTDGRGRVVPSGVYFVRFAAGGKVSTGRLTLAR